MNDDLLGIAFGAQPGLRVPSRDLSIRAPVDLWLRAVAVGAHGYYAAAAADLDDVWCIGDEVLRSLACSTRASHLRQSGRHLAASRYDGEALRLVSGTGGHGDATVAAAARLDALVGLAADNLGTGRFDVSERLLNRAEPELDTIGHDVPWVWTGRPRLRHAWVRTELALYRGDPDAAARAGADAARLAADCPSVRHRLKTDLIGAASAAAAGDTEAAASGATECAAHARAHGQLPLEWAATTLLAGVGSPRVEQAEAVAEESRLRSELNGRGGRFGGDPATSRPR